MTRTSILLAISLFLCLTATAFQRVGGQATRKGSNKKNSTTQAQAPTQTSEQDARAPSLTVVLDKNVKLELVLIRAGSFTMGDDDDGAKPVHRVNITKPFYLGKYEVTQAQWKAVTGNKPDSISDEACGGNCPVDNVGWYEAQEFIKRLNARHEGYIYRLPTEAEWEYAARAGTTSDYAGNLDEIAWYGDNSGGKIHPVGQKKPNAWGLYDMFGNVYEWVQDKWHDYYNGAPTDGSAWVTGSNNNRPLRGGSYFNNHFGRQWSSAYRNYFGVLGNFPGTIGFRLVVSVRGTTIPKPRPNSQTIEGSVLSTGGMGGMSDFLIESGGKRYSGTICNDIYGILCLNAPRVVRLASRAINTAPTKTDENGFQAFFKEFCSAVRKRDRAALELLMSPTFEFTGGYGAYVKPSVVFDSFNDIVGWKDLEKSVATGTKPYKDSSPQTVTRVTNSNDNMVLFELGSDGKWRWLRFLY